MTMVFLAKQTCNVNKVLWYYDVWVKGYLATQTLYFYGMNCSKGLRGVHGKETGWI